MSTTINNIIEYVDAVKPNLYDDAIKTEWIVNLEYKLINNVTSHYEPEKLYDPPQDPPEPDPKQQLMIDAPYDDVYKYYLMAMIDFHNGETDRYVNSMTMYNAALEDWERYYNRTHMPKSGQLHLF